jgi:hypothetical protein
MRLLTWISVIYAAVLVLALALSLIAIAALLWRVSFTLGEARTSLLRVRDATQPLKRQLGGVADAVLSTQAAFATARAELERAFEIVLQPLSR